MGISMIGFNLMAYVQLISYIIFPLLTLVLSFWAWSYIRVMDYDDACFMQLSNGCVCIGFLSPMHK